MQLPVDCSSSRTGVLCAGALVLDTLVRPIDAIHWGTTTFIESIQPRVGGSAANTARALGILGVPVRVAASLGNDEAADVIRHELERCHVDDSFILAAGQPTPQTIVLVRSNGDRHFLHHKGCSETAFHTGLQFTPGLTAGIRHLHLASLFVVSNLRNQAASILRGARAAGLTTSLDTCWDPQGEWMPVLSGCLPELDVLFMNEDEAAQICAGNSLPETARQILASGPSLLVIKQGSKGCRIFTQAAETICPPYDVQPRDTTGAGDCFVAGFLAAYLEGAPPERAGLMGNAAGALSVQQIGAVEGLLPRTRLEQWMADTPRRTVAS